MSTHDDISPRVLRIEIWMKDNMEWSIDGDGSEDQFKLAEMKVRSLFKDEEELKLVKNKDDISAVSKDKAIETIQNTLSNDNLMLCDEKFTRMMVFFYLSKVE
ncbi:MAG: hypothetical protein AAF462_08240 [Thermodesulfobacteriota bacterium]